MLHLQYTFQYIYTLVNKEYNTNYNKTWDIITNSHINGNLIKVDFLFT